MFGYIDLNTEALSEERVGRYKAYYCGLCKEIQDHFGRLGRLSLSNDMTFLTVLLSSLYEPREEEEAQHCALHPVKPRQTIVTEMTAYAADMNLLLAYWKFQDGKRDDRSVVQGHMAAYFQDAYEALKAKYPRQTSGVEKALENIWQLEDGGSTDIDALCRLSGEMLGSTFVPREDIFAPVLQRVGEGLGQFVYLMDAYEDRKADKRKGRFNPLLTMPEDTLEDVVEYGLTTMMESACSAFRLLPLEKDLDLLENVLYSGVWNRYVFIRENRKKKDGKEGEADEGSV